MTIQADATARCSDCRGILDLVFAGNLASRGLPVKHLLCQEGKPDLPGVGNFPSVSMPVSPTAARHNGSTVERCNHLLTDGRTCVHAKDAPHVQYERCPAKDTECHHGHGAGVPHRHSHSWQMGDARYSHANGYIVDMETGEVTGILADDTSRIIGEIRAERAIETDADKRANARRVLRQCGFSLGDDDGYTVAVEDFSREAGIAVDWHYHGASGWSYGKDQTGRNFEMSPEGKIKRIYSLNERRDAVTLAQRFGPTKASRKYDIPLETVRSWMKRPI